MIKIRQAVIPAAGLGTRFLPVTKCCPKELIPLLDKPCLQHVVDEAVAAGVEEFVFVISREKELIRNYFLPNDKLNAWLEKQGQGEWAKTLKNIESKASYRFVYQDEPSGLGHAVWCAREAVTDDHFFVILPDDIIAAGVPACAQMAKAFSSGAAKTQGGDDAAAMLAVMLVKWEEVSRYGIVRAAPLTDAIGDVQDVVEKPKREDAPSNLAVIGRYILPKKIFALIEKTRPGAGGEIQLTDALRTLINDGGLRSFSFEGERYDTGTPLGWVQANFALALKDERYAAAARDFLKLMAAIH